MAWGCFAFLTAFLLSLRRREHSCNVFTRASIAPFLISVTLAAATRYPVTGIVLKVDSPHRIFEASCAAIPGYTAPGQVADHDCRRSGSFTKSHPRHRVAEESHGCRRRSRSRVDRKLAGGPGVFRERDGDPVPDGFLRLLPALQNHPRVTFGKGTPVTVSPAPLRPELLVQSRRDGGISVKANFSRKIDHEHEDEEKTLVLWNATDAWLLRNNEFVRCGEALPAGSTHLLERPLLLEGDRALHFLAFDLPQLREAFDVRAGEGVRLPEIATARPAFELRLAGTLNGLTGELMCTYGDRAPMKALANAHDQFVFRETSPAERPIHLPDQLLIRNLDAENAAVARLEQMGFAERTPGVLFCTASPMLSGSSRPIIRDWSAIGSKPHRAGREVDRRDRRVTPKLEIVGSGQDWFEVRYR